MTAVASVATTIATMTLGALSRAGSRGSPTR
jgi:hypothetical protein